jgi:hypothetical protein
MALSRTGSQTPKGQAARCGAGRLPASVLLITREMARSFRLDHAKKWVDSLLAWRRVTGHPESSEPSGLPYLRPETSRLPALDQGAYRVKTKSREAFAWQGAQVLSWASVPGLPSLSKWANPQPPVAAYFFESLTIN